MEAGTATSLAGTTLEFTAQNETPCVNGLEILDVNVNGTIHIVDLQGGEEGAVAAAQDMRATQESEATSAGG